MKYLVAVLLMLLTGLLTACGGNDTARSQVVLAKTLTAASPATLDPGVMENLINALNQGRLEEALNLFNDFSVLTEVDQAGALSVLPDNGQIYPETGGNHTYTGKVAIRNWLQYEINSNLNILPRNYIVNNDNITLDVTFYYENEVVEARLDAQTQGDRFNSVTYYIQKVNFFPSDN
jgi:hypothetical protein